MKRGCCKIEIENKNSDQVLIGEIGEEKRKKPFVNFLERYCKLVDDYCNKLNLDDRICETAKGAVKIFHDNSLYARKPSCVAAAGVLIGCWLNGVKIKNCEVVKVADITRTSLSKSWKDIAKHITLKKSIPYKNVHL